MNKDVSEVRSYTLQIFGERAFWVECTVSTHREEWTWCIFIQDKEFGFYSVCDGTPQRGFEQKTDTICLKS